LKDKIKQKVIEAKKEAILDILTDYFNRVGYANATASDIAKELNISVGALYKLFNSKDELYFEYIKHQINIFYKNLLKETIAINNPKDRLKKYIELKFNTFCAKKQAFADPLLGDPLFFTKYNANNSSIIEPIAKYLEEQLKELHTITPLKITNFMQSAYIFNANTMAYIDYWLVYGGDLKSKVDECFNIALTGLIK